MLRNYLGATRFGFNWALGRANASVMGATASHGSVPGVIAASAAAIASAANRVVETAPAAVVWRWRSWR